MTYEPNRDSSNNSGIDRPFLTLDTRNATIADSARGGERNPSTARSLTPLVARPEATNNSSRASYVGQITFVDPQGIWSKILKNNEWLRAAHRMNVIPTLVGSDLHLLLGNDKETP